MPLKAPNSTPEQIKAVEAIVLDANEWLQEAWDGKVNNCMKRVIIEESNLNPSKMSEQNKNDWIKGNNFKTRKQKDKG